MRSRSCGIAAAGLLLFGLARPTCALQAGTQEHSENKLIHVTAERWQFSPQEITVPEGDHVRIELETLDGTHGFEIKKYKAKTVVHRDETVSLEFVADKPGEFEIVCTEYCGSGHERMRAKLIVQPKSIDGKIPSQVRHDTTHGPTAGTGVICRRRDSR